MIVFTLPDLGEGMEEAEIIAWLVQVGDRVSVDQPFVEVQTDKALIEMPSPVDGVVTAMHAAVGDIVPVGAVLIEFDGDSPAAASHTESAPRGESAAPTSGKVDSGGLPIVEPAAIPNPRHGRARAAPAVRRLATELGIDLTSVTGSGDGGRVLAEDVRDAATRSAVGEIGDAAIGRPLESSSGLASTPGQVIPLRGIQRRMAQAMTASLTIPHITGMDEFDATNLVAAREQAKRACGDGPSVTFLAYFLKATALTLRAHPMINATLDLDAEQIVVHNDINIGMAVATPTGLIVPIVRNVDGMSIRDISVEAARLTALGREGRLAPDDLKDGTFTITNYGALGRGRFATPIIRQGEVAILGFGALVKRPWVVDDQIEVRPVLPWSFSADHRVIDGQLSGSFQRDVIAKLANPHLMLLDA